MTRKELCNLLLWTDNGKKTDKVIVRLLDENGEKRETEILGVSVSVSGRVFIDVIAIKSTKFSYATVQCESVGPNGCQCVLPKAHGGYHHDGRIDF